MASFGAAKLPRAKSVHKFSTKERKSEAKTGVAMRDGSFPIRNKQDLSNARQAIGRANPSKRPAVRAHISARAKALGVSAMGRIRRKADHILGKRGK